ncbi:MAG: hypothetical protein AB7S26_12055 [Sandaracinaceae bacterium]
MSGWLPHRRRFNRLAEGAGALLGCDTDRSPPGRGTMPEGAVDLGDELASSPLKNRP